MNKSLFFKTWLKKGTLFILCLSVIAGIALSILSDVTLNKRPKDAQAFCTPCFVCSLIDTALTVLLMNLMQDLIFEPIIEDNIEDHINSEENWIVEKFFKNYWLKALAELTQFLSAFGMYQVGIVGTFFDANNILETRRLYFKLQAEAHKDYHPSDDYCWFGTNTRSLASTESRAHLNMLYMSKRSLERQIGSKNTAASRNIDADLDSRWDKFVKTYCDPKDNSWTQAGSGLDLACDRDGVGTGSAATGAIDMSRVNIDVDYTRLIDEPRTIDVDFSGVTALATNNEEDIMAMAANLYGEDALTRRISLTLMKDKDASKLYMELRSIAAKRSVAESSYNAIVSMKSAGTNGVLLGANQPDVGLYMASLVRDMMPAGATDAEVLAILGDYPSYYAQLEFLGKKIYQNPDFYANLYDTPANVKRKSVAMKAIELMIDRALFESELRQEMILSVMLSSKLNENYREINRDLTVEATR